MILMVRLIVQDSLKVPNRFKRSLNFLILCSDSTGYAFHSSILGTENYSNGRTRSFSSLLDPEESCGNECCCGSGWLVIFSVWLFRRVKVPLFNLMPEVDSNF
jgi:hypothetical protein